MLINVAPQVEHLQPYAAQRLVAVLVASSRRWIDGASAAAATAAAAHARVATNSQQQAPVDKGEGITSGRDRGGDLGNGAAAGVGVRAGGGDRVDDGEVEGGGLSDVQVMNVKE